MATYLTASVETNENKGSVIWEKEISVAAGETSDWIVLPDESGKVDKWLVSLITSGSARVESTNSIRSKVIAGTAVAYAWSAGNVAINTTTTFENVSAVRVVSVTGAATIEVRTY